MFNKTEIFLILVIGFLFFLLGIMTGMKIPREKTIYHNCIEDGVWIRNNTGVWVCIKWLYHSITEVKPKMVMTTMIKVKVDTRALLQNLKVVERE